MVLSEKNATFVEWWSCYLVVELFSCLVGSNDYPRSANKPTTNQTTNKTNNQTNKTTK